MTSASRQVFKNADIPFVDSSTLINLETIRVADALDDNRVALFYQPIVRAGSNNFVAFYEGLARIVMPDNTTISAGQFMPFVESSALGSRLDRHILRLALEKLSTNPIIRISINLSVRTMTDTRWLSILELQSQNFANA